MATSIRRRETEMFLVVLIILGIIPVHSGTKTIELQEDNWSDMLAGEWMVEFYAPWCPACQALEPTWDQFAGWGKDLDINVAKVDVTQNPGLSGRFLVTALPTIYHVKDGVFRVYLGSRNEKDLIGFVDDKQWKDLDPVPWYMSPGALHMSVLSMFFRLSMLVRTIHNNMTELYNVPTWGSYLLFAVVTIMAGLILGLGLVLCCDCLFPPRPAVYLKKKDDDYLPEDSSGRNTSANSRDDESDIPDDTSTGQPEENSVRQRHTESS
ncbi:thioredoxin-related transmembrane protein 1 [Lingula anatina]|uniref:Thioredoxin-related transmembrane protein 1 n=1 Tax=Lingula anatina TaxID=7574 RepID=A0A1S3JXB4_LINAN|nr:thioredoxin-related transmembrane protein 1 [Lingula anatina]|eukprot:XP_013415018.1 thioredoxin-related transmembrane protein 1 [Lingula anatina]